MSNLPFVPAPLISWDEAEMTTGLGKWDEDWPTESRILRKRWRWGWWRSAEVDRMLFLPGDWETEDVVGRWVTSMRISIRRWGL